MPDTIRNIVEDAELKDGNLISDAESEVLYTSIPLKFLFSIRSDKLPRNPAQGGAGQYSAKSL